MRLIFFFFFDSHLHSAPLGAADSWSLARRRARISNISASLAPSQTFSQIGQIALINMGDDWKLPTWKRGSQLYTNPNWSRTTKTKQKNKNNSFQRRRGVFARRLFHKWIESFHAEESHRGDWQFNAACWICLAWIIVFFCITERSPRKEENNCDDFFNASEKQELVKKNETSRIWALDWLTGGNDLCTYLLELLDNSYQIKQPGLLYDNYGDSIIHMHIKFN